MAGPEIIFKRTPIKTLLQATTTANREAISLYRDVLRVCRAFTWKDPLGRPWGEVLAKSARDEFEAARTLKDPEMIARLLVDGRYSLDMVREKFAAKQMELLKQPQPGQPGAPPQRKP
eukprot:TRINITY_DN3316_c0_g1::TRINITY_DN3316_c0_g1_i1::g.30936::m.30936 TRINITY_DN3316_c0_g1::TRINITY_DN3316_c0_g1_i1::g.30936  ORF type:complete len:118 (+),score=-0.97,Complex1_LYR/PF05347.10/6.6e-13,Complex1_LYR_1/PF13232.1/1.8e-10 TRINITY_DN3316_c0_g1_i1:99-452(+)